MKAIEIREAFLSYFEKKGHKRMKSSSLIPAEDPTLLFTNAGMVPFKDAFLGHNTFGTNRATTAQKCVRAGGKHNDLENVGFTPRHHTFFEMLGNFSFGDYFKEEAIVYAWEWVTQVIQIPQDRLWITIFHEDEEAQKLWQKIGVSPDRIVKLDEKDNFWSMGPTGPCGPCTEIHYDWQTSNKPGEHPGNNDTRFLEIWNLVFMQFNRDEKGTMTPLPKPSVDTGAGLERLACLMQNVFNNYDTDLFAPILKQLKSQFQIQESDQNINSIRVIMDHIRSSSCLIADGVTPSNEGRGYVLRRILRRAIRHAHSLGRKEPIIFELVDSVKDSLGNIYPELKEQHKIIRDTVKEEESRFHETLSRGLSHLDQALQKTNKTLDGKIAFQLYDTFGFPLDLTQVICDEKNIAVDVDSFQKHMETQRENSGKALKGAQIKVLPNELFSSIPKTKFLGYEQLETESQVHLLLSEDLKETQELNTSGYLVTDQTSFYAESGGQVGDQGSYQTESCSGVIEDTQKQNDYFIHKITVSKGTLKKNQTIHLAVDSENRQKTTINHTLTHLLHAALRNLPEIGPRIRQAGSYVSSEQLRFDFSCPRGLSPEELSTVEQELQQVIDGNFQVSYESLSYDEAIKKGAIAFFDEKYGDTVRVISITQGDENYSTELCGGTHLKQTQDIGTIVITQETSISSGTRRIIALSSKKAINYLKRHSHDLIKISQELNAPPEESYNKTLKVLSENKELHKQTEKMKGEIAKLKVNQKSDETPQAENYGDYHYLYLKLENIEANQLRELSDQYRDKVGAHSLILISSKLTNKSFLCLGLGKKASENYHAGKMIGQLAPLIGGRGGGKPQFAQAGGSGEIDHHLLFETFEKLIREKAL